MTRNLLFSFYLFKINNCLISQRRGTSCQKMSSNCKTSSRGSWPWHIWSPDLTVTVLFVTWLLLTCSVTRSHAYSGLLVAGNYFEFFRQKLERNELVLRDDLKLLLHLCQSAEDMVIARDAMFRYRPRSIPLKCRVCELSFKHRLENAFTQFAALLY